jgi:hypothetical protein
MACRRQRVTACSEFATTARPTYAATLVDLVQGSMASGVSLERLIDVLIMQGLSGAAACCGKIHLR